MYPTHDKLFRDKNTDYSTREIIYTLFHSHYRCMPM